MNINDLKYWNFYYNKENRLVKKSNFAALIKKKLLKKRMNILEIGTGNGRDAFYFSKHSNVLAIDQSSSAINENKLKAKELNINNLKFKKLNVDKILQIKNRNKINLIYARFFIHSINLNRENKFLNNLSKFNKTRLTIALEFRTTKDKLMNKGKKISKFETYTDHYRRFIDPDEFVKKIINLGFKITYKKLGINLSKTKNDNPHLCRIIFCKI